MRTRIGGPEQGQNSASLRSTNLALVLQEVLRASEPPSRAEVAQALNMTRSTASRLVDELIAGGFLAEGSPVSAGRGRPATPLIPAARNFVALGIEANVDRTVLSISDLAGNELASLRTDRACKELGPSKALAEVAEEANALLEGLPPTARLVGIQLAVPGLVDRDGTTILNAPNLGWDGTTPATLLSSLLQRHPVPLRVSNDVDAGALTVLRELRSAEDPRPSFIYITGEIGIGSGLVSLGKPMAGTHGWSGELGHACVDPSGKVCGCGARGCLETVAGQKALLGCSGSTSLEDLHRKLDAGESTAVETLTALGTALGIALSGALNLIDMTRVVLGGHLGALLPWIRPALESELRRRVLWSRYLPIELLSVEDSVARPARGAALRALGALAADPARHLSGPATT